MWPSSSDDALLPPGPTGPGEYDGHDDLDEHMPWTRETIARYYRTKAWWERFTAEAAYYRETPCPEDCSPRFWQAMQYSAQSMADDLAQQMALMREQGLVPEDVR